MDFTTTVIQHLQNTPIHFSEASDILIWDMTSAGDFLVATAYAGLRKRQQEDRVNRQIWGKEILLKVSFFLWRQLNGLLPFDSVLVKMDFVLASKYPFHPCVDSIKH